MLASLGLVVRVDWTGGGFAELATRVLRRWMTMRVGERGLHRGKCVLVELPVISQAASAGRLVFRPREGLVGAFYSGSGGRGSVDYLCGSCARVLLKGMAPADGPLVDGVLICASCGSLNDTRPTED